MKKVFSVLVWVGMILGLLLTGACKKSDTDVDGGELTGVAWVLHTMRYSEQNVITVTEVFSITFNSDGTMSLQVACNTCAGGYESDENGALAVTLPLVCTEVFCGPDSMDTEFHAALGGAVRYAIHDTTLTIHFGGQGQLIFNAQ